MGESRRTLTREQSIFFAVFLLCGIFVKSVPRVNDASRFATLEALVDQGTLAIDDSVFNYTIDKAFVDGRFYSEKAPGPVLFALPAYFVLSKFFGVSFSSQTFLAVSLTTLFSVGFFAAALCVLLYRFSGFFLKNERKRFLVLASLLSTGFFPFSTVFSGHIFESFFLFASFYLVFFRENNVPRNLFLSGLCSGLAFLSEYPSLVVAFLVFLYLYNVLNDKKKVVYFLVPALAVGSLVFFHNHLITGNALDFVYNHVDEWEGSPWEDDKSFLPIETHRKNPLRFLDLLFDDNYGFFTYSPISVLSVFSAVYLFSKKTYRKESSFVLLSFLAFLFFFGRIAWIYSGGCTYGSRHFVALLPFFTLILAPLLEKGPVFGGFSFEKIFAFFFWPGFFINLLGALLDPWLCPFEGPVFFSSLKILLSSPLASLFPINFLFAAFFATFLFRDKLLRVEP